MRFAVILFVLTRCEGIRCEVVTTGAPTSDFVDELKKDLRRNNDDYVESTTVSVKVSNPYLLDITKNAPNNDTKITQTLAKEEKSYYRREPSNKNELLSDRKSNFTGQRRVFDSFRDKIPEPREVADIKPDPSLALRVSKGNTFKITKPRAQQKNTTLKVLTNIPKLNHSHMHSMGVPHIHHNKENRLKNFIERNKQLFQEFVRKKKLEAQNNAQAHLEKLKLRWKSDDSEMSDGKTDAARPQVMHPRADSLESTTVHPELLDMAPARGGEIHRQRVKGRLCQRHVLIPEGPKYNSRGEVYVAAYGHHRGRDYARTPRPKYLLPRCCNCCRKSLLGCE